MQRYSAHAYTVVPNVWFHDEQLDSHKVLKPLLLADQLGSRATLNLHNFGIDSPNVKDIGGRRLECYCHPTKPDLGPYTRWLVGLKVLMRLQRSPEEPWTEVMKQYAGLGDVRKLIKRSIAMLLDKEKSVPDAKSHAAEVMAQYSRIFLHSGPWCCLNDYQHGPFFEHFIRAINAKLVGRPTPLTLDRFLSVSNLGSAKQLSADTLLRFEHWLLHGVHPPQDDLRELHCEKFLQGDAPDDARSKQLQLVYEHALQGNPQRPLINVHDRSCWSGLRAFSTALLHRLITERGTGTLARAVIYIPLSGGDDERPVPGLHKVISTLRKAFSLEEIDNQQREERLPNLLTDLEPVRRGLSLSPTVVVFDAVDNSVGPMSALFETIKNTQFTELLSVLMQPHVEVARACGTNYPSRFVVLSGERLAGLDAWSQPPQHLASPPNDCQAHLLICDTDPYAVEVQQLCATLGVNGRPSQMHELYAMQPDQIDALFERVDLHELPNETDLALARMLSANDIRTCLNEPSARPDRHAKDARLAARRAMFSRWLHSVSSNEPIAFVALAFIAASINGMRFDTLERCMRQWFSLVRHISRTPPDTSAANVDMFFAPPCSAGPVSPLKSLSVSYRPILTERISERVEAIGSRQVMYELQQFPDSPESLAARMSPETMLPANTSMLNLRQDDLRELFFFEMSQGELPLWSGVAGAPTWQHAWELIHYVLSAECLRQAATQSRNLPLRNFDNSASLRRLVQAVFHGLLSAPYDRKKAGDRPALPIFDEIPLPSDVDKRYRYLYLFVFRHGIENAPEWSLGRAYGKTELRFALLTLFVSPAWGTEILARMHSWSAPMRALKDAPGQSESPLSQLLQAPGAWLASDPALQMDVLQALGRAAFDSGRAEFAKSLAAAVLHKSQTDATPFKQVSTTESDLGAQLGLIETCVTQLRHLLHPDYRHREKRSLAFSKLFIDACQIDMQLKEAHQICVQWLQQHGVEATRLERLGQRYDELPASEACNRKTAFEERLMREYEALRSARSAHERNALSDMLLRLAEIRALDADQHADWKFRLPEFLDAYGLYWLADRLRSSAISTEDDIGWPMVSAIPIRIYIRVTLKISRILTSMPDADDESKAAARAFYAHARARLDVYSRHLFRLPRERVAMLLLMATAARTWVDVQDTDLKSVLQHLKASQAYIDEAQNVLLELGMPSAMQCRFFFERTKTLMRLVKYDAQERPRWYALARSDFAHLSKLAEDDCFYKRLLPRCDPQKWFEQSISR